MKEIKVVFPDGYDEVVRITAIGREIIRAANEHTQVAAHLVTRSVELEGHDGEILVIKPHERPEWRKPGELAACGGASIAYNGRGKVN